MTRLQILELPEGASDERPPYVLVVDECAPQRVIIGMDHAPVGDYWAVAAARIGARGAVVTAETVEIPANDVGPEWRAEVQQTVGELYESARQSLSESETLGHKLLQRAEIAEEKLTAFEVRTRRRDTDRMDAITNALGFDRIRDWDEIVSAIKRQRQIADNGEHLFGEPGYEDPQRCAQCGLDRSSWIMQRDTRTCSAVRVDAESGHEFRPIGERGELACLRCGVPRIEWAARREAPACDVVRQGGE